MPSSPTKPITIYTDGACSGNPGPGGYGVVLIYNKHRKELSRGFRWTTNNRMELMALIAALQALKEPCRVTIHTDSKYLMNGFEKKWLANWKRNGWKTSTKEPVQNQDLWQLLDQLLSTHPYTFHWIKGHADDTENNRCDLLAVTATRSPAPANDTAYEATHPYPKA